jgi:hypothetical protein
MLRVGRALLLASVVVACGTAQEARPSPRVASSLESQNLLADVQRDWAARGHEDVTSRLTKNVDLFLATYPNDAATPLVRAYAAVLAIGRKDLAAAERLIDANVVEGEGTTSDLMVTVRAHVLRTKRQPEAALDLLRPLVGKLVDPVGRDLFLEELTLAAMESHLEFEAIAYMDAWLTEASGEEHERVRARVDELLKATPSTVLEATYRSMRERGKSSGYSKELRGALADRLGVIAVEKNDSALARWLLEPGNGTAPARSGSEALQDLASSTRGLRTVQGRTIGVLLPGDNVAHNGEAAEVIRGVSWALGLPQPDPRKRDGIRLVTRDAGDSLERFDAALEELAGEGAAVIIGGFDAATAARAMAWGDALRLTVMALAAPTKGTPVAHGVVLGETIEDQLTALAEAVTREGATRLSMLEEHPPEATKVLAQVAPSLPLVSPAVSCDAPDQGVGLPRFPVKEKERENGSWLVAAPSECLRDLALEYARTLQPGATKKRFLATTLEAGIPHGDPRIAKVRVLTVGAGIVPVLAARPDDVADIDVRGYMMQFGARPSYWAAIGRDAGALARRAVTPLPLDTASDEAGVLQRRAIVEAGVLAARVRFWSSEMNRVEANRYFGRKLRVVDVLGGI